MSKYASATDGNNKWTHFCKSCHYGCSKSSLMTQHEKTKKHTMLINAHKCSPTSNLDNKYLYYHSCSCGKKYKHIQSYNRHLKTCNKIVANSEINNNNNNNIVGNVDVLITTLSEQYKNMVTENVEMRRLVKELLPRIGNTTINNQFNIQMFLNEECKDALNLSEFIETLKLDHKDLSSTHISGYSEGITNIFIRGLKALDFKKRPIHCSDLKHETLYVKDYGIWEKETADKQKIKSAITSVSKKQLDTIIEWEENHPNWRASDKGTQEYCEMIQYVTYSTSDEETNKIIKSISREIILTNNLNV